MYITLKITADTFEAVKAQMNTAKIGNYYETPAGAQVAIKDCSVLPVLIQGTAIKPYYDCDPTTMRAGYTVTENVAVYCTSAGNIHGVTATPEGEHIAFYWGRRSRSGDLWAALEAAGAQHPDALPVVEYRTEGPSDMLWWEDRVSYTLRQDDLTVASVMSSREWDADMEWCRDVGRHLRRTPERLARVHKLAEIARRSNDLAYRRQRAMA